MVLIRDRQVSSPFLNKTECVMNALERCPLSSHMIHYPNISLAYFPDFLSEPVSPQERRTPTLIVVSFQVSCDVDRSSALLFPPHMTEKYAEKCGLIMKYSHGSRYINCPSCCTFISTIRLNPLRHLQLNYQNCNAEILFVRKDLIHTQCLMVGEVSGTTCTFLIFLEGIGESRSV